jgi:hypothetical protein
MPFAGPSSSSFRGVIGVARQDITPPPGIHMRNWGAATHDVADGVHRPLTLTTLTIEHESIDPAICILMSADLMSWRSRAAQAAVLDRLLAELRLPRAQLMFCLTHTHAAPSLRPEDADKPGGNLIAGYHDALVRGALRSIPDAQSAKVPATLTWRYGRCDLATNRDLPEPGGGGGAGAGAGQRVVCGFNPAEKADDTLLVGRVTREADGAVVATIVNYACHPTTLAWQNRLLSPDFVGAMRETVERHTGGAPCLFLQGASGELAPAEQYTGDVAVADRHGRRLGHAVLATLEAMDLPSARLAYDGVVESGAPLAAWRQQPDAPSAVLALAVHDVELPLKNLPPRAEIEAQWRACDDPVMKERLARQIAVRSIVGDGDSTRMPLWTWRLGDAVLVGQPNEAYSQFQTALRERFPGRAVAVMNLVNGSAAYLPPRESYGRDVYQVWQSPYAAGALETLTDAAERSVRELLA